VTKTNLIAISAVILSMTTHKKQYRRQPTYHRQPSYRRSQDNFLDTTMKVVEIGVVAGVGLAFLNSARSK